MGEPAFFRTRLLLGVLAVIPILLGHSLFNWVLKWLNTNMVSVAILFEQAGAIVLAYWILNETE
ncbi:hypothetical protein P9D34_18025 [Bacillus swezeyi]|nr:hypothetical protein [Bacillus swezeyi]MEC1262280.1 hypothetical protein [Bacillus swezeyi]MED2927152.1 hypothetical protein [Bacillus swezeyi]MED2962350.1 hypothetical protein [Bacillus swezeyi]MED3072195.1 hypothetical protein [Bacillus swezeyi]MED3084320.1 hypothetical protein [Bacillus swezeyi]